MPNVEDALSALAPPRDVADVARAMASAAAEVGVDLSRETWCAILVDLSKRNERAPPSGDE